MAKTVDLQITPEQMKLVVDLHSEIRLHQDRLQAVLGGIVAGHGYVNVMVAGFDVQQNTLKINAPDVSAEAKAS